jgi:tetratricopeptide (TPR) repeat protein
VELESTNPAQTFTVRTDARGAYRFWAIREGTYTVRARLSGMGRAESGPLALRAGEAKKLDLTLGSVQPEFYEEPRFVVAGVTDAASPAGHGSDVVLRSAEALAKATAALRTAPAGTQQPPSSADLDHALAAEAEKRRDALAAARMFQRAAEQDPSERNLFDWGTELLTHRATEPALAIFTKGHRIYPGSTRLLLGLAVAWYAGGHYPEAAQGFFKACDLNPSDRAPYLFLGKVQSVEITRLPGYADRLARFCRLMPEDAWANLYYAVSLWNPAKDPADSGAAAEARRLLEKAIQIDPQLGAAYLRLGVLDAQRQAWTKAIADYQAALAADPALEEAHYRLAQVYGQTGDREKSRAELALFEQLSDKSAETAARERREVPQLVIELTKGR